jgi:Tfp pilus assembly major pilin PilA
MKGWRVDKTANAVGRPSGRSSFLGHSGAKFFCGKSKKRSPGKKLWKRRAKNALGNQKTISTFRTASTTTSLTIVITF